MKAAEKARFPLRPARASHGTTLAKTPVGSSFGSPKSLIPLPLSSGRGASPTLAGLLLLLVACSSPRKDKASPVDAGPPAPVVTAPVVVIPDAAAPNAARAAEIERAKGWLADLKFLLANKQTTSPQLVSGEGDATAICDAATAARPKTTDPEVAAALDEALPLCAFDVPLLVANEALDHLKTSTSQASVRLMCTVSAKEIAKAKAVKPKDPKVVQAERRRSATGRCH